MKLRLLSAFGLLGASALAVVAACSSGDDEASFTGGDAGGAFEPDAGVGQPITATGVIIVHSAALPSLRLCFEADDGKPPLPMDTFLPGANEVGLVTGGVVRVAAIPTAPGRVIAYDEASLTPLYPPGSDGPSCHALGQAAVPYFDLGMLANAPDAGVSVMVLSGCQAASDDPDASVASCGDDWTPAEGNLAARIMPITPYGRPLASDLPLQVIQLSPGLDRLTRGQVATLSFGDLDGGGSAFVTQPLEAGALTPDTPVAVAYDPTDTAAYARTGFALAFDAGATGVASTPADAGDAGDASVPVAVVAQTSLRQSLADIVAASSAHDVPPAWLATKSSYVLLVIGDPNAPSGGANALHFVIAPVAIPSDVDAGGVF